MFFDLRLMKNYFLISILIFEFIKIKIKSSLFYTKISRLGERQIV